LEYQIRGYHFSPNSAPIMKHQAEISYIGACLAAELGSWN